MEKISSDFISFLNVSAIQNIILDFQIKPEIFRQFSFLLIILFFLIRFIGPYTPKTNLIFQTPNSFPC